MSVWDKIVAFVSNEVKAVEGVALPAFSKLEQEVVAVVQPLFAQAEAGAMKDLISFVRGVLTTHPAAGSMTLPDWETAVLNGLGKLEGQPLDLAKGLGSNSLQALIGLLLAKLPA